MIIYDYGFLLSNGFNFIIASCFFLEVDNDMH